MSLTGLLLANSPIALSLSVCIFSLMAGIPSLSNQQRRPLMFLIVGHLCVARMQGLCISQPEATQPSPQGQVHPDSELQLRSTQHPFHGPNASPGCELNTHPGMVVEVRTEEDGPEPRWETPTGDHLLCKQKGCRSGWKPGARLLLHCCLW